MTDGPRNPTPQAPDTAPGAPATDGSLPAGVDQIGEGFEGSMVTETPDDGEPSSVQPPEDVPESATETEKQLADEWYHEGDEQHTHVFPEEDKEDKA
jgi:hypothetical protein